MPHLYMLCGPAGSGKTTTRSKILDVAPDAVVLSSDDIIEARATCDGLSYNESYLAHRDTVQADVHEALHAAIAANKDIIWDQTNLSVEIRTQRLAMLPDSYERTALAFEAPLGVLHDRVAARRKDTGKHIPSQVLIAQFEAYERPHFDEGFDHVSVMRFPGPEIIKVA